MSEIPKLTKVRTASSRKGAGFVVLSKCRPELTEAQAAEVIRRAEAYEDLVRLGKGFVEISEEVLKDVMANVELAYKFQHAKEILDQALKEQQ